jgi:2-phosphoglycerate kinase
MQPDWRVLLIGGGSGVGKTRLARQLAQRFGVSLVLADDIRMAVQRIATAEQHPALHYFLTQEDVWHQPVEDLVAGWIGTAEVVSQALVAVIAHHICVPDVGAIIIEGDGVLPSLAVLDRYDWCPARPADVRAVVLHEPEESVVLANMHARGRGFDALSEAEQQTLARGSWLFGDWLRQEAENCGVVTLDARPWETLETRVLATLQADHAQG